MNAMGTTLVWCAVQVTVVGLLGAGLYVLLRRVRQAAAVPVVLASLAMVVVLTLLAASPWPRWLARGSELGPPPVERQADKETADGALGTAVSDVASNGGTDPGPSHIAASPADGGVFWRALVDELSRARPAAESSTWQWPAVVGVVLMGVVFVGLGRLALGLAAVRKERLRSRLVVDRQLTELVDVLRAELGCRREVEVRECGDLATAATIGWRRPVLLVPTDWASWTVDERRAVLAHELAHVRGRDCLWLLLGQLGLALHFYHPLVHWLARRLRLEQELAADAAAASVSGGQRAYLLTIARLTLRVQDRPVPWPARAFLPNKTTFLRRIAMLRDAKLSAGRLSPTARMSVIGLVLLIGFVAAGLRGPSGQSLAAEKAANTDAGSTEVMPGRLAITERADKNFISPACGMFIVVRPADALSRPEVAPWKDVIGKMPDFGQVGMRLADFRQITVVAQGSLNRSGLREIVAFQSVEPMTASSLLPKGTGPFVIEQAAPADLDGKRTHTVRWFLRHGVGQATEGREVSRRVYLQFDERTIIVAPSETALRTYLASDLGTLPPWMPEHLWDKRRGDHVMYAIDTAAMGQTIRKVFERGQAQLPAIYTMLAPVWEDSTRLIFGFRVGDGLWVGGAALAKDEMDAEVIERTLEAARVLGLNALRKSVAAAEEGKSVGVDSSLSLFKPLLADMRVKRKEKNVSVEGSMSLADVQRLMPLVLAARRAAERTTTIVHLRTLAVAMHNYHDAHRRFPPAVLYGPDGKTPYSWRVAILPYIEQQTLYDQYRRDEPWDSPANRKVLARMPDVFRSPTEPAGSTNACYFALTGPGTVFDATKVGGRGGGLLGGGGGPSRGNGISIADIPDGSVNTLLLVEAKCDIPWTKPEDIPYDPNGPLPGLGGFFGDEFHAALADGSVRRLYKDAPERILRAIITRAGMEVVNIEDAIRPTRQPPNRGTAPQPNQGHGPAPEVYRKR